MKEQKQRFHDDDGDQPEDNDKENNRNAKPTRPHLSIAVSMSEDAEEPARTPRESPFVNVQAMVMEGGSIDYSGNASAWAMMENYELGSKLSSMQDGSSSPERLSESPIIKDASDFWDKSFTADHGSMSLSPGDSLSEATPSTITRATTAQQIFVAHKYHSSATQHIDSISSAARNDMHEWNNNTFGPSSSVSQQVEDSSSLIGQTPAKMQQHWIREKQDGSASQSPPVSLMQESVLLSDKAAHEMDSTTIHTIPSANSEDEQSLPSQQAIATEDDDSMTQDSMTSPQRSLVLTARGKKFSAPTAISKSSALIARPSSILAEKESPDQLRLKERVQELEQALRATVATPRGTVIQENPIKTLLDRNQTLVKEVRFADSTCVELSGKVSALESERNILKARISSLEEENRELRRDFSHAMVETASLARSTEEPPLSVANARPTKDDEGLLRQAMDDLKMELSEWVRNQTAPIASSTSALLSDMDLNLSMNDMDISHVLTKTLQLQVELMKEHKEVVKKSEELEMDLLRAQARNSELEERIEQETKPAPIAEPTLSLDLSRAQEESDFLGRQLGKVQEKLDQTRKQLEDERKNSISIDSKWRTETAGHLRTIRSLEAKIDLASESLAISSRLTSDHASESNVDYQVVSVEQDILNMKTVILTFKNDLEMLLSKEVSDNGWMKASDGDAQLIGLVATFMERMRKQYATLNFQVDKTISQYCDRLNYLSEKVLFLQNSLMFETDSVSTNVPPAHSPEHQHPLGSSPQKSIGSEEVALELEDDDDDDLYSRMEEARDGERRTPFVEDASTDLDDISRFLSDDSTLESMLKTGASEKSVWEYENLKKSLEAAVRECQRVRERSLSLKSELNSEKIAFSQLTSENRRLVVEHSQKEEERQLLEDALNEAKTMNIKLKTDFDNEKVATEEKNVALQSRCDSLETQKDQLEESLNSVSASRKQAQDQVASLKIEIEDLKKQLASTDELLAQSERDCANLKARLGEVEGRAFEVEDLVLESRVSQEDMRKERALMKAQISKLEAEEKRLQQHVQRMTNIHQKAVDEMAVMNIHLQAKEQDWKDVVRRLASIFHDILSVLEKSEYNHALSTDDAPDAPFGMKWALLEQVAPLLRATFEAQTASRTEIESVRKSLQVAKDELQRVNDMNTRYKSQAEEEKGQNAKLFELLQQAELEMERSATQIRELSTALTKQQHLEAEMLPKLQATEKERNSLQSDLVELRGQLSAEKRATKQEIGELSRQLDNRKQTEEELQRCVSTLESKSARLRQYVKKLTIKCEEWEMSYGRQSKSVAKLQAKNARMKDKISEMAARYKELSSRLKSRTKVRTIQ